VRDKFSRWRNLRAQAEALWDESALHSETELSRLHKFGSFCVQAWKSFTRNRCPVRASALAYASLLALIPMLAVIMSITTSFLKQSGVEQIDHFIVKLVASVTPRAMLSPDDGKQAGPDHHTQPQNGPIEPDSASQTNLSRAQNPEARGGENALPAFAKEQDAIKARKEIARRIHQFIENTQTGALGITGAVALIFAAISMLGQIESTFNDIWGVARGRSWFARVMLYWALISLAPILITVTLGLTTGTYLTATRNLLMRTPFFGHLLFQLLPVVLLCLTLGLLYRVIPNTKVHWNAALTGGAVAGVLWHLNSLANVLYVSRVVSNFRIYGSLGLVPVFMIGLYFAWLILLLGAQIAYAVQNRTTYVEEKRGEMINERGRELAALRVIARVARRFHTGQAPPTALQLAKEVAVPTRIVEQILCSLRGAHLIAETNVPEPAYLPARPLEAVTCNDILLAIRGEGAQAAAHGKPQAPTGVSAEFHRIAEAERKAACSVTLQDLAERVQSNTVQALELKRA